MELYILSDGTKIPPLIIFRGEANKNKEKKLQNNEQAKKGLCSIKYQPNSWADNSIFIQQLTNIWFNNGILKHKVKNSLLILESNYYPFLKTLK